MGDKLTRAGVHLFSVYGCTEYGVYTRVLDTVDVLGERATAEKTKDDWMWLTFMEERMKLRWEPQGDGTYELHVLVRGSVMSLFNS